jgi:hypothetical protein
MSDLSALSGSVAEFHWLCLGMSDPQLEHIRPNPIPQWLSLEPDTSGPQVRFQRHFSDMSDPQPGHVRPNPISQRLSPGPDISSPQAEFQRGWPDVSGLRPEHVRISDTPTARFSWGGGAIKGLTCLSSTRGHPVHIANTLKHSLELPTSHLQASFKSKLSRRDLSLILEWPTRSSTQALHRWSLCIRYSWGFVPLDGLDCPGVTKVVVNLRKFVLPSLLWRFDSGNRTRSWWSFGVDYDWKRPDSLWAPQQRHRRPLWVSELQKEILCLCVSHIDLFPVLV